MSECVRYPRVFESTAIPGLYGRRIVHSKGAYAVWADGCTTPTNQSESRCDNFVRQGMLVEVFDHDHRQDDIATAVAEKACNCDEVVRLKVENTELRQQLDETNRRRLEDSAAAAKFVEFHREVVAGLKREIAEARVRGEG